MKATEELELFFGVGVVFLFFLIGVEDMDVSGLSATVRGRFFLAGVLAFLVSFGVSLFVMLVVLERPMVHAIAVAGIVALSSLGVVAKVLRDLKRLREPLGLEIFTTVVIVEMVARLRHPLVIASGMMGKGVVEIALEDSDAAEGSASVVGARRSGGP